MKLYYKPLDPTAQGIKLMLLEKNIECSFIPIGSIDEAEELSNNEADHKLPAIIEKSFVLSNPFILIEYIEERYPYSPLLPSIPTMRSSLRYLFHRIYNEWTSYYEIITKTAKPEIVQAAQKSIFTSTYLLDSFFQDGYFGSKELTFCDCMVQPLLWQLPYYGIEIDEKYCKNLVEYTKIMFERPKFQESLEEDDREIQFKLHPKITETVKND